jgi:O-antigen/teichoic acid export membrane protein
MEPMDERPKNLGKTAVKGVVWSYGAYAILFVVQTIGLVVLARLLSPEDFGIFAIGAVIFGIGKSLAALGLSSAVVQREGPIDDYIHVAWTSNFLLRLVIVIVLAILAPFIVERIFHAPTALWPLWALLILLAIDGLSNPTSVILLRKIEAVRTFWISVPAIVARFIGSIIFALFFPSVWALVFGYALWVIIAVIATYLVIPGKIRFVLDLHKTRELYAFGGWLQLKSLLKWLSRQIDTVAVGSLLGPTQLGFYERATTLASLPQDQVIVIANSVTFPMFSAIQNGDPVRIRAAFKHSFDLAAMTVFPMLIAVLFWGERIVKLLMGEEWIPLTQPFQILIAAVSIESLIQVFFPLMRGLGYPRAEFILQVVKIVIMGIFIYPLTSSFAIEGAAFAMLLSSIVAFPLLLYRVRQIASIRLSDWLSTVMVCVGSGIGVALLVMVWHQYIPATEPLYDLLLALISGLLYLGLLLGAYCFLGVGPIESVMKATSYFSLFQFVPARIRLNRG